jgi:endonuclease/exonuclease/phosphatase family metal-dependent hydrolase
MAASENASELSKLAIGSYQTALCVIPPAHLHQGIDRLRALYDKAHGKWPAHINVFYPFVAIENLPRAIDLIRSKLLSLGPDSGPSNIQLRLDTSDYFSHRRSNTIFIAPSDGSGGQSLKHIRSVILEGFKHEKNDQDYCSHLTIGQSPANAPPLREYLLDKAKLLLPIEWRLDGLVILVRERQYNDSGKMKIWGTVNLSGDTVLDTGSSLTIHKKLHMGEESLDEEERQTLGGHLMEVSHSPQNFQRPIDYSNGGKDSKTYPETTYQFSSTATTWQPIPSCHLQPTVSQLPATLTISSYNILHDPSLHHPTEDRYPILLASLLSHSALADILVLQEVTDDFLSYILGHEGIRNHYSFTTHAPPNQDGIGPLGSFHNVVALSRWRFGWEWLPFDSRHKGAVVLRFEAVGKCGDEGVYPLVVAGVHLTCGLTDGAVAAKKLQLQTLLGHLSSSYSKNPWIIAGDFNITTSKFAIEEAVKMKCISLRTATDIAEMETMLADAGLVDSWVIANAETEGIEWLTGGYEDLYEGEEGATFNATLNPLAAEAVKRNSNNMRPQRYDRILVNGGGLIEVIGFNMFGFPKRGRKAADLWAENRGVDSSCGSDHWGIRGTLRIDPNVREKPLDDIDIHLASLQLRKAPSSLSDDCVLNICLTEHAILPTDEEVNKRNEIFTMVKNTLQQSRNQGSGDIAADNRFDIPLVVVPVGSYGLGVWSSSSDIDTLCIGCISSKAFFTLVTQRLNKSHLGIRILRKVNAASGTMLELEFKGVKLDLQYCPATKIVERYAYISEDSFIQESSGEFS